MKSTNSQNPPLKDLGRLFLQGRAALAAKTVAGLPPEPGHLRQLNELEFHTINRLQAEHPEHYSALMDAVTFCNTPARPVCD
ncbi:MAG: hypothetical protein U5J62_06395 [Desulfurivibrio sp.]|nr:hypothetical protein [Desulfurivibrio sp.]